ncbi:VMAP-C domain-containing protein [Streptomyces sp. SP18CS02]|uniref:VMAP-C domain-containing protein n=1 Tax=Streptomyces sp. SP18CS02 TaxID=3002531 RepID=UPI002E78C0C1|nr:trypsin-like peptidase domain-containing protein [Streptomyces sp. SP18CS02]MEE1756585.1 trypsin-like peptidase domain-containing protein [Streptomyces sp. SP18CS02]
MGSPAWHARVDRDGEVAGSGFLVTERTVLTCAHVVADADRVSVSFPAAAGVVPLPATVVVRGSWAGSPRDAGDLAVLALDEPVALRPAVFAPLEEPITGRLGHTRPAKLVAYGFPEGYDEGVLSELRAGSRQLIGDEWAQLEDWKGYGQPLAPGFSGAAAVLEEHGTVVGMITANDPDARNGRMIPAHVLARHWPALADRIPTLGYGEAEKRHLRALVERTPGPAPGIVGRLLADAVGPVGVAPPSGREPSLWEAVWHLLSEAPPRRGVLPLAELTVRLADLVEDATLGRELRDWAHDHRARFDEPSGVPGVPRTPFAPYEAKDAVLPRPPMGHRGGPGHTVSRASAPHGTAPQSQSQSQSQSHDIASHGTASHHTASPFAAPDGTARQGLAPGRPAEPGPLEARAPAHPVPEPRAAGPRGAGAGAREEAGARWSPILVEVRHSGAGAQALLAEVSAYRDGARRLVGSERLGKGALREWVLDRIDDAFGQLDTDASELIAFALPRSRLNEPVEQWARRKGDRTPLGCQSPVVVMDHDRRSSERLQFKLKQMWAVLDGLPGSTVHRVVCHSGDRPDRLSVRLQDVHGPVGFARPPRRARDRELHWAALDAPSPIVLWPRTGCTGAACSGRCAGSDFLDTLAGHLATLPPSELPRWVFELRKSAFLHEGAVPHWADGLSLMWEDPRWFPAVRRLGRSPVA